MKNEPIHKIPLNEASGVSRHDAMVSVNHLPMFLTAKDLQQLGFSRSMAYQLMNRADVPVLQIGERKFIPRDKFFAWVEKYPGGLHENEE